jgi:hypothetical protein
MTQDEIEKLNERVAWLERKMVRVLWLLISATSGFAGFMVGYTIDKSPWMAFDTCGNRNLVHGWHHSAAARV